MLEMVKAFEDASGVKIPMEMAERRPGDVAESYATCDLAEKELGFKCKYTIFDMCKYLDNKPYGGKGCLVIEICQDFIYFSIILFQVKIHGHGNQKIRKVL